jgi:hypothetical protein
VDTDVPRVSIRVGRQSLVVERICSGVELDGADATIPDDELVLPAAHGKPLRRDRGRRYRIVGPAT